jgi:hypothetical protein
VADREQIRDWSDALLTAIPPLPPGPASLPAAEGLRKRTSSMGPMSRVVNAVTQSANAGRVGLLPTDMMKMYHFPVDDPDGYVETAYANMGVTGWVVGYRDLDPKKKP